MTVKLLDKFKGCMVGGLVGDCLGANFECQYESIVPRKKVDSFFQQLRNKNFDEVYRYTDDTAMAKQIAEGFIEKQSMDYSHIATRFSKEYFREPWRGYGGSVVEVFIKLRQSTDSPFTPAREQFNGSGSYGNGAGMRAHPIALAGYGLPHSQLLDTAIKVAELTHAHQLGVTGGVLQTLAVARALTQHSGQPGDLLRDIEASIVEYESGTGTAATYSGKLAQLKTYLGRDTLDLSEVVCDLGNDVSAVESVPTALFCYLHCAQLYSGQPQQFEETVKLAIHLGGDTDTIASMAGAIAGAHLGIEAIPRHLQSPCESLDSILALAEGIHGIVDQRQHSLDQPPQKKPKL